MHRRSTEGRVTTRRWSPTSDDEVVLAAGQVDLAGAHERKRQGEHELVSVGLDAHPRDVDVVEQGRGGGAVGARGVGEGGQGVGPIGSPARYGASSSGMPWNDSRTCSSPAAWALAHAVRHSSVSPGRGAGGAG